jgi:hypothetical protein
MLGSCERLFQQYRSIAPKQRCPERVCFSSDRSRISAPQQAGRCPTRGVPRLFRPHLPAGNFMQKAALNEDKRDTREGAFSAGQTHGAGFRQIGSGPRLHLEIAMDGKCNVHIDSHGYVLGPGQYDWNRGLEHGYWDLLSDKAPGLFGSFGNQGQVGPMIRPMQGVDGRTRWVIGLTGHW